MENMAQYKRSMHESNECSPGLVTNIPANMVVDQFGMIGLLTFIRYRVIAPSSNTPPGNLTLVTCFLTPYT